MKKLKILFLYLCLASFLGAQSLSFSVKEQALNELDNIQLQNEQLLKIISDYEANYQMLKIDYESIKALTQQQEKSLEASNQALINSEKLLKASRTINYILGGIVVGFLVYVIIK